MQRSILNPMTASVLTLTLLLPILSVQAQDSASSQAKTAPYAMPELPALSLIGGQANNVTRPVTPRALATDIIDGVDSTGHLKQGLAVAVTPFSFLGGNVTLNQYQGAWWRAALYNAQVSAGSVRTSTSSATTDLGTGLRLTLYDNSDPMRDTSYTGPVRRILTKSLPENPDDSNTAFIKAKKAVADFRKQWRKDNWSKGGLAFAAASGWRLSASSLLPNSANRWLGWSAWATQSFRVTKGSQIIYQTRYTNQQQIKAPDGAIQTNDQFDFGVRAVFGSAIVNFFAETTGVTRSNPLPNAAKSGIEWAGGIEFRASDAIWISTSLGKKLSNNANSASALVFAGLRWEVNTDARIQVP